MSRENLQNKTCKELRELAKERNISGRWDMTKEQLIEAILGAKEVKKTNERVSAKDEYEIDNQDIKEVVCRVGIDEGKKAYIENISIGTIVAFRLSDSTPKTMKVKSAKVIKKSTKNRKLKLVTNYGAEYTVSYDDIVWVRTGKRWPKGVYKLLKGIKEDEGNEKQ